MARNPSCTVYVGNLDEKVTDRILYEILIQVGHVVDLYIPRDKETNRLKGYAFAEYESEEIAEYAVRLFSGLVRLYKKTLKFAISGHDKPSHNTGTPLTPKLNSTPVSKSYSVNGREVDVFQGSAQPTDCRVSAYAHSETPVTPKTTPPVLIHSFAAHNHSATPVTPETNSPLLFHGSAQSTDCRVSAYSHLATPITPMTTPPLLLHGSVQSTDFRVPAYTHSATPLTPNANSPHLPMPHPLHAREMAMLQDPSQSITCRVSAYTHSDSPGYSQASARGFVNNGVNLSNFDYGRRFFGSMSMNGNRPDIQRPNLYPYHSFLQ